MTLSIYTVNFLLKDLKKIPEVNISHLLLSLQDAPGSERLFVQSENEVTPFTLRITLNNFPQQGIMIRGLGNNVTPLKYGTNSLL